MKILEKRFNMIDIKEEKRKLEELKNEIIELRRSL